MTKNAGFSLTTVSRSPYHRGFEMTLKNGYVVSVQFGPGSISSIKNFALDEPISLDTIDEKVENAEFDLAILMAFNIHQEVSSGYSLTWFHFDKELTLTRIIPAMNIDTHWTTTIVTIHYKTTVKSCLFDYRLL